MNQQERPQWQRDELEKLRKLYGPAGSLGSLILANKITKLEKSGLKKKH